MSSTISSKPKIGEKEKKAQFLVVSYFYKGSIEFIVIRDSWKLEEMEVTNNDDSDSEEAQHFLWPKNWKNFTTRDFEELYEKKDPDSDWRKYAILRIHKTKANLLDAKNARNRAEDDFTNKKKRLSEIGDTTDDNAKTIATRKSRNKKQIDEDFISGTKRPKLSTSMSLSSKIQAAKECSVVIARKSFPSHTQAGGDNQSLSPVRVALSGHNYPSTSGTPHQLPPHSPPRLNAGQSTSILHQNSIPNTTPNRILSLQTTPPSRYGSHNIRTLRTVDSFLKALGEEKFREGQPLDAVHFKFYMTGMFLGIKSLQNDVSTMRAGTFGSSIQPAPPVLGPKPLNIVWPLNPSTFAEQEDFLKDDYVIDEMTIWLSNSNNSQYSTKFGEMAKKILHIMFRVELEASFVFSKESYSKTEVRFEGTRTYKMIRGALEKAHGSGKEKLVEYRETMQYWWDHKADNFKEFLQRRQNAQILSRFGDDNMLIRDRIKLFKEHYSCVNDLNPRLFVYDKQDM